MESKKVSSHIPFPDEGQGDAVASALQQELHTLERRNIEKNLGLLYTPSRFPIALSALQSFIVHNPNNIGDWSYPTSATTTTRKFEHEVVQMMTNLYGGNPGIFGGYLTSGGTEGNTYLAWLGYVKLRKKFISDQVCLLKTTLAHYSISKAAKVVGVTSYELPISSKTWGLTSAILRDEVSALYAKGCRGFMIPLTIGYTFTGTADAVDEIIESIPSFKNSFPGSEFFVWVDASLDGLVFPFCDDPILPLRSEIIEGIVVDFHKFWGIPYGAGLVIRRECLVQAIKEEIPYLPQFDTTLSGSRQGATAAAVWAVIQSVGRSGLMSVVRGQIQNKESFVHMMKVLLPQAQVITRDGTVTCGVRFSPLPNQRLPEWFEKKYWLFAKEQTHFIDNHQRCPIVLYKFHFMPHVTPFLLEEFESDLRMSII